MSRSSRYRFAFVSNSIEIAAAVEACSDPEREKFITNRATMEEALLVARQLIDDGVEVVIGGGATGRLMRQNLNWPVVTIGRTHLDILRALLRARSYCSYVALTSFDQPVDGMDELQSLLDMQIRPIVFSTTQELVKGINQALTEGVCCIVGSGICSDIAIASGGQAEVVLPSQEVILRALEEARAIASAQRQEREKSELLRIILQNITEGVIGVDDVGRVNIFNHTASKTLGIDASKALNRPLNEVIKNTGLNQVLATAQPEVDKIRRIGSQDIVINSLPIEIAGKTKAAVGTFKPAERIQNIDRKLKEQLYAKGFTAKYSLERFKGDSPVSQRLRQRAKQFARSDAAVLIQGETGCGKEILAQAIHKLSPRQERPFLAVNCSALPESLLESELFGYEEGAFTGAKRGGKPGLFELASQGTLFLDEIADIPIRIQMRLLRVLEEKQVMRVGGDRITPVDVRILSSTYRDLVEEIREGRFRPDLYYRLAVLKLSVPPLRERPEDFPAILSTLLADQGLHFKGLSRGILDRFLEHGWPGNVREMDTLIRRYASLIGGKEADETLLLELLNELKEDSRLNPICLEPSLANGSIPLKEQVKRFELRIIRAVLQEAKYNRKETATRLGISVNTLWRKLSDESDL